MGLVFFLGFGEAAIHSNIDEVSQDLLIGLIGMKAVYDKHLWTMKAYLG